MPATGALLTEAEREAFTPWLELSRARSGKTKNAVKNALADQSIQRVNRYFGGGRHRGAGVIPMPLVLARIAKAIDVPWPIAYWRAGYFRELLGAVDLIARFAQEPTTGSAEERLELETMVVRFALRAFPRRDASTRVPFQDDGLARLEPFFDVLDSLVPNSKEDVAALTSRLPALLERAAVALSDSQLPAVYRRSIAGDYVNAWADAHDLQLADRVRAEQRSAEQLINVVDYSALTSLGSGRP